MIVILNYVIRSLIDEVIQLSVIRFTYHTYFRQMNINKWNQIPEVEVQCNKSGYIVIRNGPKTYKMSVWDALNQWQFLLKCTISHDHNSIFLKAEIISFKMMHVVWVCGRGELNFFKLVSDRSSISSSTFGRFNLLEKPTLSPIFMHGSEIRFHLYLNIDLHL